MPTTSEKPREDGIVRRARPSLPRRITRAVMVGFARALGVVYDPRPPLDAKVVQETSGDDEPLHDAAVRLELGKTPTDTIARVRRP